jgi:hypothetical protein
MGKAEMGREGRGFKRVWLGALLAFAMAAPAAAQFSDSYKFLKAVRDRDGQKVTEAVEQPGSTVINTKDYSTGESALHIVVKRRDATWLAFLLAKGAKPDIRDNEGATPLLAAAQLGFVDGVRTLLAEGASVNLANSRGETPLIMAVHNRGNGARAPRGRRESRPTRPHRRQERARLCGRGPALDRGPQDDRRCQAS